MKQYRHGDILLISTDEIDTSNPSASTLLAEGEGKNHGHFIEGDVNVFEASREAGLTHFLEVKKPALLRHQLIDSRHWTAEHQDIEIPPGKYRVIRQREFDPFAKVIREVND